MAEASVLTEVRLPAFKSIRDAVLPLPELTLLVGRNGSGKSNVLDGLWVLSRLASGGDLRELLDGGRDGPAVRGGAEGCAPLGTSSFTLGCTVETDIDTVHLDVTACVDPVVQVTRERLWTTGPRRGQARTLLETDAPDPHSADIVARWNSRKQGRNPPLAFRATQLLTSQVTTRVPATTVAGREVHRAAECVLAALKAVFILDPVPHEMRRYVPIKDNRLRRSADNLSAVVALLLADPPTKERLLTMVRTLSETHVSDMKTIESALEDVMVALVETIGGRDHDLPARLMSDGTLRFLAILAALLETPGDDEAIGARSHAVDAVGQTTLVIEELENGLHPSQAAGMIELIKAESSERQVRTLATTHSPAMLDALTGDDHQGVVVCARDDEGWTRLARLTDLPNYFRVVTAGTLGSAAEKDRLRPGPEPMRASDLLDAVLGVK